MIDLSIVIPAKNEGKSLQKLIPELTALFPGSEIIVVNDGSKDDTSSICKENNIIEVQHPYSMGNGAAIKSGARHAKGEVIVFMDGDGQHRPEDIERLVSQLRDGYDMVVGARSSESQANKGRWMANSLYNQLASFMVGHKVMDLTSGFRAVRATKFKEFLNMLPNGFSYPTTITMAFFRAGYSVNYLPIVADRRIGKSHINLFKDGVRFLLIIFRVATLYSPLKMFAPISLFFFSFAVFYYVFTYFEDGRFTNMGMLLFNTSIIVFLLGLVSEQITHLTYMQRLHGYGDARNKRQ